jgi:hypothetical protein
MRGFRSHPDMAFLSTRPSVFLAAAAALVLLPGCEAPSATRSSTGQVGGAALTAVFSRAGATYTRAQNPDGSFVPETYGFKNGGNFGGPRSDETMDKLTFEDVTKVIRKPLQDQDYVPSEDPNTAKLLILVYWGTTICPDDVNPRANRESAQRGEAAQRDLTQSKDSIPGSAVAAEGIRAASNYQNNGAIDQEMEEKQDEAIDAKNANILGYTDEVMRTRPGDSNMSVLKDEVEHDRYYVVLLAYDYQEARKFGIHTLLWETRFSIPETGNDFEKAFPTMAAIAGKYFGQDSHGLVHHNLADTHVEIGETRALDEAPAK